MILGPKEREINAYLLFSLSSHILMVASFLMSQRIRQNVIDLKEKKKRIQGLKTIQS